MDQEKNQTPLEEQLADALHNNRALVTMLRAVVDDRTWQTLSLTAAGKEWDSILRENGALARALLNQHGDNLCWIDGGSKIPPREEFLESCRRYHAQIVQGSGVLEGGKTISQLEEECAELSIGLRESVKLQTHYAKLLNGYDGGQRMAFDTHDEWLERLRTLRADKLSGAL